MSANNFLKIEKDYTIKECDADTFYCSKIAKGKSLRDAIKIANKYMEENEVEYGLRISLQ